MRKNREDSRDYENMEPRWAHGHHHGENSDRGNYTVDSRFNSGYGAQENDYYDSRSFNTNIDQGYESRQGRFQPGGAQYSGEDFAAHRHPGRANPYGMSYFQDDDYNSGRHYDPGASYRNRDYDELRHPGISRVRPDTYDERFGHEVSRRRDRDAQAFRGHSAIGDYESYRRYEMNNPAYDNDYSGGFAGRTHTEGRDHFGEDTTYSTMSDWSQDNRKRRSEDRHNRH
jgi:hypothetical protein